MTALNGRWTQYFRDANLDALLDAYGTPADKRDFATANMTKHKFVYNSPDGVTGDLTNIYPTVERKMSFKDGQEFDYTHGGGQVSKAVFSKVSETKFDLKFSDPSGTAKIEAELNSDELVMTTHSKGVSSVAKYRKE